jgi:hypothetical protein
MFAGHVEDALFALDDALGRVEEHLSQRAHESDRLAQLARRAAEQRHQLIQIAETPDAGQRVAYSEARGRGRVIGSRPVDVSDLLRSEVWQRVGSVVLTSATLSTGGDFKFIRQRLGIDFDILGRARVVALRLRPAGGALPAERHARPARAGVRRPRRVRDHAAGVHDRRRGLRAVHLGARHAHAWPSAARA